MSKLQILIVDDDANHRDLIQRAVQEALPTAEVVTASDGGEALSASAEQRFDCYLIDFNLGDCTAAELIERINTGGNSSPAIVISSSNQQDIVVRSIRSGCVDFINKNDATQALILRERVVATLKKKLGDKRRRKRLERRMKALQQAADTDLLTGLSNRQAFDRFFLQNDRKTFDRRGDTAAIFLDIDHFKSINDRFGHARGDAVLISVADLIERRCDQSDLAIRWGGEEFVIIKPQCSLKAAIAWAEDLRLAITQLDGQGVSGTDCVTASFGLCVTPSVSFSTDTIEKADRAMYCSKRTGRNRVTPWCDVSSHASSKGPVISYKRSIEETLVNPRADVDFTRHRQQSHRLCVNADEIDRVS